MTGECARVLKQRSMTRVRVDDELGIGQMRAASKRVDGRDHRIVVPNRDKYRLRNLLYFSVGLASGPSPGPHRAQLCSGRLCTSWSVLVSCPPSRPLHTLSPAGLAVVVR